MGATDVTMQPKITCEGTCAVSKHYSTQAAEFLSVYNDVYELFYELIDLSASHGQRDA